MVQVRVRVLLRAVLGMRGQDIVAKPLEEEEEEEEEGGYLIVTAITIAPQEAGF
jgi:hypothetical protein